MRLRFRDEKARNWFRPSSPAVCRRRGRSLLYNGRPPPAESSVGIPLQSSSSTIDPFPASTTSSSTMQEVKPAPIAHAAPAPAPAPATSKEPYIQQTPKWVLVVRGFQAFFAFVILAMCGYLIHGHAMDANVFALVVVCSHQLPTRRGSANRCRKQCLMTWVVVVYSVVTEKFPGANSSYNIWAVLSLDLLMAIFWLSSMGANAALRASFIYSVNVDYCVNDGSAVSSNTCVVSKRDLERRAAVAGSVGLAVMSAIAGLSALVM